MRKTGSESRRISKDKQADTQWRLTMEARRRRRGWRLCRLPGLWRRADPAREWRTRKPPTGATRTWTASLSRTECRRWQDARAPPRLKARENGARAFIAPPLGGWEGLNQQESVTVDASGGNWHSLLTVSPFCPACPGICA